MSIRLHPVRGLFVALAFFALSPDRAVAQCIGNLSEDFGDGSLSPLWTDSSGGNGTGTESGGRLVMSKNAGVVGAAAVTMASPNKVCGDFDISVDFDLGTFPAAAPGSGRFHALLVLDDNSGNLLAGAERYREQANGCIPSTDSYKFYTTIPGCNGDAIYVASGDMQGKLRLVRQGTTIHGYYWNGSAWIEAMTRTIPQSPIRVAFTSGTNGSLMTGHVAYFDNLSIQSTYGLALCDGFDDGSFDTRWQVGGNACGMPSEGAGELIFSQSNGCSNVGMGINLDPSKHVIQGNFDISVDYRMVDFSVPSPGDRIATLQLLNTAGAFYATIERYNRQLGACNPGEQNYKAWFETSSNCDASVKWAATTDTQGRFRLTRTGSVVTAYYWNGGWVALKSASLPIEDVKLSLLAGILNGSSGYDVRFDNLCINANFITAVPPLVGSGVPGLRIGAIIPNPFRSHAAFAFSLPRGGRAHMNVYDITGRHVGTVFDGVYPAGEHRIDWSAPTLPAGMYFLRLDLDGEIATRRILVLSRSE